jgi:hypothetical protein
MSHGNNSAQKLSLRRVSARFLFRDLQLSLCQIEEQDLGVVNAGQFDGFLL